MLSSDVFVGVTILALLALLANLAEQRRGLRVPLYLSLMTINTLIVWLTFQQYGAEVALLALGLMLLAFVPLLRPSRGVLTRLMPKRQQLSDGTWAGFNPEAPTHITALVFCIYLVTNTLLTLMTSGGTSGIRAETQASGEMIITPSILLTQMALFVIFAFLGAGFGLRRSLPATLQRLGLRAPTLREVSIGVGIAILLYFAMYGMSLIWQLLAPPQLIDDQTSLSGLIAEGIDTLFLAFMLAFTAAIGEEIVFRGALQPVFGVVFSSAVFALTHIQYALTPAVLIIFVISLGFAYVRQRYHTTVAIIAHFFYNFGIAALLVYARYVLSFVERL